jgi:predicted nuclease of predicted toxin-antitoxin system
VKLLFDENLSPSLAARLAAEFPESTHVRNVGLLGAEDRQIWEYARSAGLAIVSKDTDFRERSYVEGAPPKIVWLDVGNAGTEPIATLLHRDREHLQHFATSDETSLLILSFGSRTV